MSNYESERGRWKLPSAEYASFRQAMQRVDMARKEKAYALTQECWKSLSRKEQSDLGAYRNAVRSWVARQEGQQPWRDGQGAVLRTIPRDEALELASTMLENNGRDGWADGKVVTREKPSRVQKGEVDWPTNRTTSFASGGATVSFDPAEKAVRWEVAENNHAVDSAHDTELGKAFFDRLGKVKWTHGTGGYSRYSSEYHEDEYGGRSGSRINRADGYAGIDALNGDGVLAGGGFRPFQNAKGEWIGVEAKNTRYGMSLKPVKGTMTRDGFGSTGRFVPDPKPVKKAAASKGAGQGRVARGVPSGGQFSARGRGESDVRL